MELFLLLREAVVDPPTDALGTPSRPFLQNLSNPHDFRETANEDIEVAGEAVLQGRQLHELCHKLIRVNASL